MIDSTNMLDIDGVSGTLLGITVVTSGSQPLRPVAVSKGALEGKEEFYSSISSNVIFPLNQCSLKREMKNRNKLN